MLTMSSRLRPSPPVRDGRVKALFLAFTALLLAACGDVSGNSGASSGPVAPTANTIAGRVTMGDGSPLRGDIKDIQISIGGVSGGGDRVSFTPPVKPDGTYSLNVPAGLYAFSSESYVTMVYGGAQFYLYLDPVGGDAYKNRDATDGIVQDFHLKFTGPTPYGETYGLDIGDQNHWHGESIGLLAQSYRDDIRQSVAPIAAGTKLIFTLTPQGPGIDGQPVQPVTVERTYADRYASLDINDLMPAPYEVTAAAELPGGERKRILLQGKGDYPNYKPAVSVPLENDGSLSLRINKFTLGFVIE